jgi:hypothetical protein
MQKLSFSVWIQAFRHRRQRCQPRHNFGHMPDILPAVFVFSALSAAGKTVTLPTGQFIGQKPHKGNRRDEMRRKRTWA